MASKRQSYHATLRALRTTFPGLTQRDAQATWRVLRDLLDRRPVGVDVVRHPVLTKRAVTNVRRTMRVVPPTPPALAALPLEPEEWEITWQYREEKTGKRHHITVRAVGPAGATKENVRRVFWRALNGKPLDYWNLSGVDWEQTSRSGRGGGEYHYTVAELATPEFRNLWNHARPRVERVES